MDGGFRSPCKMRGAEDFSVLTPRSCDGWINGMAGASFFFDWQASEVGHIPSNRTCLYDPKPSEHWS